MRTVTIYSSVGEINAEHRTAARTWGELKIELDAMDFNNKTIAVLETESIITGATSILPTSDFTLVITPNKNKAGNFDNLSYKDLIAIAGARGYSNIENLSEADLRHLIEHGASGVFPILSHINNLDEKLANIKEISSSVITSLEEMIDEIDAIFDEVEISARPINKDSLKAKVEAFVNKLG